VHFGFRVCSHQAMVFRGDVRVRADAQKVRARPVNSTRNEKGPSRGSQATAQDMAARMHRATRQAESLVRARAHFTGAKRCRPTTIAPAPSKDSMAAPIAVSSWNT